MGKISGIYCIENKIDNKKYIGFSTNIKSRWSYHKSFLNKGNHDNSYLQNAWNKHGEENFIFYILEKCEKEKLEEREVYFIDLHKTKDRDKGYNLSDGGNGNFGWIPSDESRIKKSNAAMGIKNGRFGKKLSRTLSQFFGVYKRVRNNRIRWEVRIKYNKITTQIGTFKTELIAAQKYNEYVIANNLPNPLNIIENNN